MSFKFTKENKEESQKIFARYPTKRSAVMPLLTLAQKQNSGYLTPEIMKYIAKMLDLPVIKVQEVATFYTMYNNEKIGKHEVNICTTTPCWLRGSDEIVKICEKKFNTKLNSTSPDDLVTLKEVECLGACVNAPMIQINENYYEDLSPENLETLLDDFIAGKPIKIGSQIGRKSSEPFSLNHK